MLQVDNLEDAINTALLMDTVKGGTDLVMDDVKTHLLEGSSDTPSLIDMIINSDTGLLVERDRELELQSQLLLMKAELNILGVGQKYIFIGTPPKAVT